MGSPKIARLIPVPMQGNAIMELMPKEIEVLESIGLEGHCLGEIDSQEKFSIAMLFASISDKGFLASVIEPRGSTWYLTTAGAMALELARP